MARPRRVGYGPGRSLAGRRQASAAPPDARTRGPGSGQGIGVGLTILSAGGKPGAGNGQSGVGTDRYLAAVLQDQPAAYWRLGESSGTTVQDTSGHGITGTYVNTPTLGQAGIPGATGNRAAKFDPASGIIAGQQQYAHFGDVLPLTGTKLSIEFWLLPQTAVTTSGFAPYVARGDVTWRVNTTNTAGVSTLQFAVGSGSTPSVSATGLSIVDGNFHHVVCVYDQINLLIYVDAAQVASKPWTTDVPAAAGKDVGISWNSDQTGRWIHATMDEVAIYTTALSSARVTAHYNAGRTA